MVCVCVCPLMFFQTQSEKLLTWDMAVKDFHLLVKLVKVSLSVQPPACSYFLSPTVKQYFKI